MAGNRPVFSIITPSYNQGSFLAESMQSVLSQAGNFAIDYIIVDGGSTDDSVRIIREYAARLERGEWQVNCRGISLRWLSEQDRGQTDALNKGFRMAEGELFAWLNSDDSYLPGALQAATEFFHSHPEVGLMYGDALYTDAAGAAISAYRTEDFDLMRLAAANIICQPAAFFRREAYEATGGLDETLHFAMDYDLWIRIGKRFTCRYLPRLLATYRLHETSKTVNNGTLYQNSEESLAVTIRHFGWAPLTRLFTSCRTLWLNRLPGMLRHHRLLSAVPAIPCTLIRSLRLNRGVNRNDLKLLRRENFSKLFKSRLEIMTGSYPE